MIGRTLSHYRILSQLGAGGMGEVYEAEDTNLGRTVAIKVLPPDFAEDLERARRFRREAECLASLDHPNIVTIHEIASHGELQFLVMARVEGETLAQAAPVGGFPLARIFSVGEQIASALAAAHEAGITHRDLKPSNVMISPDGRVRVLDFGLAKQRGDGEVASHTQAPTEALTGEGHVLGTIPYMSPEQVEGKTLDHRTDVFSLGAVLYEMATGARPFSGNSPAAVASAILRDSPARIDSRRDDLPKQLHRIIHHCLEKDPSERHQTVRDVYNQLRSLRKELEIEKSMADSASGTATRQVSSSVPVARRLRFAAMVLLPILLALLWWTTRGETDSPLPDQHSTAATASSDRKMIAVLPFENLGPPGEAYFAAGITEEITSRLAGVRGLGVISRTSVLRYDRSGKTMEQIGTDLGVGFVLDGTIRWARTADGSSRVRITPQLIRVADDSHVWADSYDRVIEDVFAVQSEIAHNVLERLDVALLEADHDVHELRSTDNLEAYDSYLRGGEYLDLATELYTPNDMDLAVRFFTSATELDPGFALAHAKLAAANSFSYLRYWDRTEARLESAATGAKRALALAPGLPEAHLAMGLVHRVRGQYEEAQKEFERARDARPGDSAIHQAIAEMSWYRGEPDVALASYRTATGLDPRRGELFCSMGGVYRMKRMQGPAAENHAKAIEYRPNRACPYFCMAYIYLNRDGGTAGARAFLEAVPKSVGREEWPPINYPWLILDWIDGDYEQALRRLDAGSAVAYEFELFYFPKDLLRAHTLRLMNRQAEAGEHYESARALLESALEKRPDDARIHSALGLAYAGLGRRTDAVRAGQRALELDPPEEDFFTAPYRRLDLAQIYTLLGDLDAAIDVLGLLFTAPSNISPTEVRLHPAWTALRGNPRFVALVGTFAPVAAVHQ